MASPKIRTDAPHAFSRPGDARPAQELRLAPRARRASTCPFPRASSTASSARTAPARRRRCACSPGCSTRTPGRSSCSGSRSVAATEGGCSRSARSSSRRRSTRTSPAGRTCASLPPRASRSRAGRVEELLELVGLRDRAKDKVSGYSLGMKQRLGIAGALLSDPKLLLLDEPANGLDPAGIVAMRETLRRLASRGQDGLRLEPPPRARSGSSPTSSGSSRPGRLVREGTLESLLSDQGVVRVRVPLAQEPQARALLEQVARTDAAVAGDEDAVARRPRRAESRRRGQPRCWPRPGSSPPALESGTDLEELFLAADRRRRAVRPRARSARSRRRIRAAPRRAAAGRVRMRIFLAGLRKLVGRPASFVSVGLLVGLLGLIIIASATVGQQDDSPRGAAAAARAPAPSRAPTTSSSRSCSGSAGSSP